MSFSLNMYNHPPKDTFIELSVLESIVNERLQLYCILEKATVKKRGWQGHWEESILQQMRQLKMENYINLLQDSNIFLDKDYTCWRDEVAHWLLLLYNSTSDELSELFIKRETEWLALRYRNAPAEDRYCFLKANHFDYPEVSQEEKIQFETQLESCNFKTYSLNGKFHKSHWSKVQRLVTLRKVFLHKGTAYFPEELLLYAVKQQFQHQLNLKLAWAKRIGIRDERITHLFPHISLPTSKRFSIPIEVTVDNVDRVAEQHYPLCMMHLHQCFRQNHHLKYDCKMQLGIFLKWIGMPYEDMLVFWREEFTKKMTEEKYNKKYEYLFKHQYGKIGGRIQYKPYTCERIQSFTPAVNQEHGCPFKHWDLSSLSAKLEEELGDDFEQLQDIEDLVRAGRYIDACNTFLCCRTPAASRSERIASPNEYIQKSIISELYGAEVEDCLDTVLDTL
nr:unnamed protein product [Callosobruchus chinensis]